MNKVFSFLLWLFVTLILVASISILALVYFFDVSTFKDDVVSMFNKNTGLILEINGDLSLDVDENIFLSLEDVTLSDSLGMLAEFEKLDLIIPAEWPKGKIELTSAVVQSPVYHFRTNGIKPFHPSIKSSNEPGMFNFSFDLDSLLIDSVSVLDGRFILYNNRDSIYLDVEHIHTTEAQFAMLGFDDILQSFDIRAMAYFDHLTAFGIEAENGNCQFRMIDGRLIFDSEYHRSRKGEFDLTLDLNTDDIGYHIKGVSREENIRELLPNGGENANWIKGLYTGSYDLNFILGDSSINLSSLVGTIKLESSYSKLYGISLDKMVKTFKKTQQFSFKDLGSVMIFGPWGLAISKGGDYAELALASKKDSTIIDYLHCQLSIDTGLLDFQDVAFRTAKNRVALMGRIDFLNNAYHNFSYALIDKEGCSVIREEYNGPFEQASSKGVNNFAILMGPVTNLFQSTSSVVLRNDCEKTYTGVVELPEKQKGFFKRLGSKKH